MTKTKKILIGATILTAMAIFIYRPMFQDMQSEYRQTLIEIDSTHRADSIREAFVKDSTRVADSLKEIQIKNYWSSDRASSGGGGNWVRGYTRKDGTFVSGHYRK